MPEPAKPLGFMDWVGRILVAIAGVYVVTGVLSTLPMLGVLRDISRAHSEAQERFGDDPAKLFACLEREQRRLGDACTARLRNLGAKAAPLAPAIALRLFASVEPGKPYLNDTDATLLLAASGVGPADPYRAPYERAEPKVRRAFAALGPVAWRELADDLSSISVNARGRALYAVELAGPAALEYAPRVAPFVRDPDPMLRARAVRAVGAMGRPAFEPVACGFVALLGSKVESDHEALRDALASLHLEFGEWQRTIGRCR